MTTEVKRRFDKRDLDQIAESICDDHATRKKNRGDLERQWDEVDRQLAMNPDLSHKLDDQGQIDTNRKWMPELELPLQAQTLEVLTADARRMMFPDSGSWFKAHVALTDEYLAKVDFESFVAGDENDLPSKITQENADFLLEGLLNHYHNLYDFRGHWDQLNAEAYKYGTFTGRARAVSREIFLETSRGSVPKKTIIPTLVPRSIRHVYLDDSMTRAMNEGFMVGPSVIDEHFVQLADLRMAAERGSKDPDRMDGGWMAERLKGLEPDDNGQVHILEMEGDIIVPRKSTRNVFIPNTVVTVAIGKNDRTIFRLRFNQFAWSSWITQPYHIENILSPYGVGPLMKGAPIQKAASSALNMLLAQGWLNTIPPIAWDSGMIQHQAEGGPVVFPGATWESPGGASGINAVQIGDPAALGLVYANLVQQYYDVTGVNAPRLGQQTKSHTTAFAKEVEAQRGVVRTVDYVRTLAGGPMSRWLTMALDMARETMKGEETFFIEKYGGFVTIKKDHLPDIATFDVFGAGGPDEEAVKIQRQLQAIQTAAAIDQFKVPLGGQPLNYEAIQREILGKVFADIDIFFQGSGGAQSPALGPAGVSQDPALNQGAPGTALQSIQGGFAG